MTGAGPAPATVAAGLHHRRGPVQPRRPRPRRYPRNASTVHSGPVETRATRRRERRVGRAQLLHPLTWHAEDLCRVGTPASGGTAGRRSSAAASAAVQARTDSDSAPGSTGSSRSPATPRSRASSRSGRSASTQAVSDTPAGSGPGSSARHRDLVGQRGQHRIRNRSRHRPEDLQPPARCAAGERTGHVGRTAGPPQGRRLDQAVAAQRGDHVDRASGRVQPTTKAPSGALNRSAPGRPAGVTTQRWDQAQPATAVTW